jgi:hypothetical protein
MVPAKRDYRILAQTADGTPLAPWTRRRWQSRDPAIPGPWKAPEPGKSCGKRAYCFPRIYADIPDLLKCPSRLRSSLGAHRRCTISITDRLHELRTQIALEQNPIKKQELLEQLLELVQERFLQLIQMVAKEENPERLRVLTTELDEIIEERKAHPKGSSPPQAE